jgi:hypothetical protein
MKKLTDELIEKKLEDQGILHYEEMDHETKLILVLDHFGSEFTHDWHNYGFCFTTTETADGYELYMATADDRNPDFSYDIYYYDSQWFEKLSDVIIEGNRIQIDKYMMDEYGFQDAIDETYQEFYNDKLKDIEDELIEQGYEREKTGTTEVV